MLHAVLLGLIIAAGLWLRWGLLQEYYADRPNGDDGTLEFSQYAQYLLKYTLNGEVFPKPIGEQKPLFPLMLAAVYSIFPATSYVQYLTTLIIGLGLILYAYYVLRSLIGPWAALAGGFFLSLNESLAANSVSGYAEPIFMVLLVAYIHVVSRYENLADGKWYLAAISAALCLARKEGLPLVVAGLVALAYAHRRTLLAFARVAALSGTACVLSLAADAWFVATNGMLSYGERIGLYFLRTDYMDTTGNSGIYSMPEWYPRMWIGREAFAVSPYEWLANFHDLSQIMRIASNSLKTIGIVVVDQLTLPVVLLGAVGMALALVQRRDGSLRTILSLATAWVVGSTALLMVFANGIGPDEGKYYLVIVVFGGLLFGYGVCHAMAYIVERSSNMARQWTAAASVLFCTVYGFAHMAPDSPTQRQSETLPGEAECSEAFQVLRKDVEVLQKDDVQAAELIFNDVLQANLHYAPAYLGRAVIQYKRDPNGALLSFKHAQQNFPWYAEAYVGSATIRLLQGDNTGAISDLTTCLELRPDYVPAHILAAQAYARQAGGTQQALAHYDAYLSGIGKLRQRFMEEFGPKRLSKRVFNDLSKPIGTESEYVLDGLLYRLIHNRLDSYGVYQVGGQGLWLVYMNDLWVYYNIGNLHMDRGDFERAERAFEKALRVADSDVLEIELRVLKKYRRFVLSNLGAVYARGGRTVDEVEWLVGELSGFDFAPNSLFNSNIGCLYATIGKRKKARALFEKILAHDPDQKNVRHNLAVAMKPGGSGFNYHRLGPVDILPNFVYLQ